MFTPTAALHIPPASDPSSHDNAIFLDFLCALLGTRAEDGAVVALARHRERLQKTYRIASSNTLFKFRCVSAEHSRYFCALISLATMTACSYCIGAIFFCLRLSLVPSSSLKSSLVPTRMMGTPGA
jgi:hypothetical protein